ncbi:MAG: NlpC/P60 family protein [Acidimicrobiales bacterium]
MKLQRPVRTLLLAGIAALLLSSAIVVPLSVVSAPARADSVGTLRSRAAAIAAQLQAAYARLDVLGEAYDQAQTQLIELRQKIARETTAIRQSEAAVRRDQGHLREAAIAAYVDGASSGGFSALLSPDSQQFPMQQAYVQAASGNLNDAVAAVLSAEHQLRDHRSALQRAAATTKATEEKIASTRSQAEQVTKSLSATLSQVKGRLAQAVAAAERARQAAAAAAAAEQAAAAAAAQQAAAQQAAAQQAAAAAAAAAAATTTTQPPQAGPPPPPPPPPPPVTGGGSGATAVSAAESQLGVPYVWGGATPGVGFDCSGLTMWAWSRAGVQLAHGATDQYYEIPHVSMSALQPGDLIFYGTASYLDHVVMYVGSGPYGSQTVIQAEHTGTNVMFTTLWPGAYGAGRP